MKINTFFAGGPLVASMLFFTTASGLPHSMSQDGQSPIFIKRSDLNAAKQDAEQQRRVKYLESINQGKRHEEATRIGASAHAYTLAKLGNKASESVAQAASIKAYQNAFIPPDSRKKTQLQQAFKSSTLSEDPQMLKAAEDQRKIKYEEAINQGKSHEEATRLGAAAHAYTKAKLIYKYSDDQAKTASAKAYQTAYIPPKPLMSQQHAQQKQNKNGATSTTIQSNRNNTPVNGVVSRLEVLKHEIAGSVADWRIGYKKQDIVKPNHEEKGFGKTISMDINKKKALINGVYSVLPKDKIAAAAIVAFVGIETSGGRNMPTEADQKWRGKLDTWTQEVSPIRMGRDMLVRLVAHRLNIKNTMDPKVLDALKKLEILLNSGSIQGYYETGRAFAETIKLYGSNKFGDVSGFFRMFRAGAGGYDNHMTDKEVKSSKWYQEATAAAITTVLQKGLLEGDQVPYFKDGIVPATYGTGRIAH
jgi:hypothetical protein